MVTSTGPLPARLLCATDDLTKSVVGWMREGLWRYEGIEDPMRGYQPSPEEIARHCALFMSIRNVPKRPGTSTEPREFRCQMKVRNSRRGAPRSG